MQTVDGEGGVTKINTKNQGIIRIPMLAIGALNKGPEGELQRDYHKDEQYYRMEKLNKKKERKPLRPSVNAVSRSSSLFVNLLGNFVTCSSRTSLRMKRRKSTP